MRGVLERLGLTSMWVFVICALGLAIFLAVAMSPFASSSPDGLERVAADKGFAAKGEAPPSWRWALAGNYAIPGIANPLISTAIAGGLGTLVCFGAMYIISKLFRGYRRHGGRG